MSRSKAATAAPPEPVDEPINPFDQLLLNEAERCESLIQQEAEAVAEELAALPAACQQRFRAECIVAGVEPGIDYRPQDTERHHNARLKVQAIAAAKSEIAQMYRHWPEVFGLPGRGWSNNSDHISGLPVPVQTFMQAHGLRIPEYISPHRQEFDPRAVPPDDPPGDVQFAWGRKPSPGMNHEV